MSADFEIRAARIAALAAAAVLFTAGCGGEGGGATSETAAVATAPAPATAPISTPAPTPVTAPAPAPVVSPSPGPAPSPSSASSTPAASPTPASPPTAADITCGVPNFKADALRLINARRAAGASCGSRGSFAATTALSWNTPLANAAYGHSLDMATQNYFSHTSADGRTLGTRVSAAGYAWHAVGENIAAGYGSVQQVVDGWMTSEGHCANLMSPSFEHMGLACARRSGSPYGTYWTLDLARPR